MAGAELLFLALWGWALMRQAFRRNPPSTESKAP